MRHALQLIDEAIRNLREANSTDVASEIALLETARSRLVSKLFGYTELVEGPPCAVPGYIRLRLGCTTVLQVSGRP